MPRTKEGQPILYKPWKNTSSSKNKYWVYVKSDKGNPKKIGFGLKGYQDFTQHGDKMRQKSYLARAKGIRDKQGNLTYKDKNTSNYWAVKLWGNKKPSWA